MASEKYIQSLNVKIFKRADEEWLDFILTCREQAGMPHNYDMVIGSYCR